MPVTIDGTSGITTPTYNGADTSEYIVPVTAFKNRIINGDMRIDQRNAGASVTPTSGNTYILDRWLLTTNQSSKLTIQQNYGSVTPPAGFTNYLGCVSTSAYSSASGDQFSLQQRIEGYNIADLSWGTASASTITISFWVRSSLTGTFGGAIINNSANRSYPFSYTISSANTWEQKTITIAGDTSGTWLTTNGIGAYVCWDLGSGSTYKGTANAWAGSFYFAPTGATSVVGTNGATFYITGVQLEKGSTATSFDYRPYGIELLLCQRYFLIISGVQGFWNGTNIFSGFAPLPTPMRATPSMSYSGTINAQAPAVNTYTSTTQPSNINAFGTNNNGVPNAKVDFNITGLSGSYTNGLTAVLFGQNIFTSAEL